MDHIALIEKVVLHGKRPRSIGRNARIGVHGPGVKDSVVRIHTESGAIGIGVSPLDRHGAVQLLGKRLEASSRPRSTGGTSKNSASYRVFAISRSGGHDI